MVAAPNAGNGADLGRYSWMQTLAELTLTVPVPAGSKGRDCDVVISKNKLKVPRCSIRPHPRTRGPGHVGRLRA